ncbi:hypothetical protein BC830DRAFT_1170257 [Chytriomyces sp. MP71]|nr:hypothetical protein BC830DRAFT_1170257 [Chytriomyces sp. MP71]
MTDSDIDSVQSSSASPEPNTAATSLGAEPADPVSLANTENRDGANVSATAAPIVAVKRGRGRPRKDPSETQAAKKAAAAAVAPDGAKRGRGRPRLVLTPEEVAAREEAKRAKKAAAKAAAAAAAVSGGVTGDGGGGQGAEGAEGAVVGTGEKRGRGRPKKVYTPEELAEREVKKAEAKEAKKAAAAAAKAAAKAAASSDEDYGGMTAGGELENAVPKRRGRPPKKPKLSVDEMNAADDASEDAAVAV